MSTSASTSASAIVANTASGHHLLKIDGYSGIKGLPNGKYLTSSPFTIGGHLWVILYYPSGTDFYSGYISLELVLAEEVETEVRVKVQFALMAEEHGSNFFRKKNKPTTVESGEVELASCGSWGCPEFIYKKTLEKSKYLKDDSFTIRCDIVVFNDSRTVDGAHSSAAPRSIPVPSSDLNRHLGGLLESGKGADVVFEVAGEAFAAHRWLLAARSPVFSAQLFGSMKESDTAGGAVRICDMEPQVFKALLCFMYTDSLPEMTKKDEDAMCQHLLVAADRYDMERLKLICGDKLCRKIDAGSVANVLALAELHHCRELKDACLDFVSTPENLRALMASDGFEHLSTSCPSVVKELIAMCSGSAP